MNKDLRDLNAHTSGRVPRAKKFRPKKTLYYHAGKKDYMFIETTPGGSKAITGKTVYRSPGVIEDPAKYGWQLVGDLR